MPFPLPSSKSKPHSNKAATSQTSGKKLGPVDPTLHEDIQVFITNLTDQPLTFQIGHPFGLLSITLAVSPPLTSPPKRSSPSLLRRPTPLHMIAEESLDTTVNTLLTAPSAHLPPPPVSPPSPSLPPSIPTPALPTVPRPSLHTTPVVEDVPLDDLHRSSDFHWILSRLDKVTIVNVCKAYQEEKLFGDRGAEFVTVAFLT